jgi:drug/metabolite transporter (DMT)-like permease
MVYLGLFPTAIGFTTWAYALGRSSAGRLGSMTYLVPPIVIVMSLVLLGEAPVPLAILGGALCIAGVIVARSRGSLPWRRTTAPAEG